MYPTELFRALDQDWHRGCFRCSTCRTTLSVNNHYSGPGEDGKKIPYCRAHQPKPSALLASSPVSASSKPTKASTKFAGLVAPKPRQLCPVCSKAVYPTERIRALRSNFHKACFRCSVCSVSLSIKNFQSYEGTLYCKAHLPKVVQGLGRVSPAASSVGFRGSPSSAPHSRTPRSSGPGNSPSARPRRTTPDDVDDYTAQEVEPENPFRVSVKDVARSAELRDAEATSSPTPPAEEASVGENEAAAKEASSYTKQVVDEAGFMGYAKAVESWEAEGDDELSFAEGDTLLVTFQDGEAWWSGVVGTGDVGKDAEAIGSALLFPLSHVEVVDVWEREEPRASGDSGVPGSIALCEVNYDYEIEEEGELPLSVGQIIHILSFDNEEWWTGVDAGSGSQGLFPSMYVTLVDSADEGGEGGGRFVPDLSPYEDIEVVSAGWVVSPWSVEEDGEVELAEDELVLITDYANDEWWSVINAHTGESGLGPSMCIEEDETIELGGDGGDAGKGKEEEVSAAGAGLGTVRVVYDRPAEDDDELDLVAGDIVTVLEETSEEWWSGTLRGREGLFPLTHVEVMDDVEPSATVKVIAVTDYDAQDDDELSFRAGDVLTLVAEDNEEWWTCSLLAHQGLCPVVYLERL